jgi:hypothetical protein
LIRPVVSGGITGTVGSAGSGTEGAASGFGPVPQDKTKANNKSKKAILFFIFVFYSKKSA